MGKLFTVFLLFANVGAAYLMVEVATRAAPAEVTAQDLLSGPVDLDGDGNCTPAEGIEFQNLLENHPQVIEKALQYARPLPDGGIDLSPFLMQFGLKGNEITLFRNGQVVKVRVHD